MLSGYRTILPLALVAALGAGAAWAALEGKSAPQSPAVAEPDTETFAQQQRTRGTDAAGLEGRLTALKERLKITAQQDSLWNTYAETVRKDAAARIRPQDAPSDADKNNPPSLIDQLDQRRKTMEAAAERLAETENATKTLYAGLSDEQKHIADRELSPRVMTGGLRRRYNSDRPRIDNDKSDSAPPVVRSPV